MLTVDNLYISKSKRTERGSYHCILLFCSLVPRQPAQLSTACSYKPKVVTYCKWQKAEWGLGMRLTILVINCKCATHHEVYSACIWPYGGLSWLHMEKMPGMSEINIKLIKRGSSCIDLKKTYLVIMNHNQFNWDCLNIEEVLESCIFFKSQPLSLQLPCQLTSSSPDCCSSSTLLCRLATLR